MWSKVVAVGVPCRPHPRAGDYYVYDVGPHSALIVRTTDGSIKAYYNACMHRGTQLRSPGTCGFATQLRCPFHGWTWSLDGDLVDLPDRWDFPHVATSRTACRSCRSTPSPASSG
jgi:phenylpropionate dioxygenase-like ring-hydroxylating dioxygenase large terminal subunit